MLAEEPACRSPAAKAYGDGTQAGKNTTNTK